VSNLAEKGAIQLAKYNISELQDSGKKYIYFVRYENPTAKIENAHFLNLCFTQPE
jgi:hypothetical protein